MKSNFTYFNPGLLILTAFLTGCATNEVVKKENYSGYLGDYSQLKPVKLKSDRMVLRWVNPEFKQRGYRAIIIEPVSFYQEPKAQKQVEEDTLNKIQKNLNARILKIVNKSKMKLAKKKGKRTLRLQSTIAAIKISRKEFSAKELIPIKLIFAAVEAAAGGRDFLVTVYFEYKILDSVTNEVMAKGLRKGKANTLANSKTKLSINDVNDLLDQWEIDWDTSFSK